MSDHRFDSGSDIDVAHDEEPRETLVLLQRTQDVVNQVFERFNGRSPATHAARPGTFDADAAEPGIDRSGADTPRTVDVREVEDALREQLALAGLPEQPAPWVGNTATEIAAGRTVIIDTRTV